MSDHQEKEAYVRQLEKRVAQLEKINAVLFRDAERRTEADQSAYDLFKSASVLEERVNERTARLKEAQEQLRASLSLVRATLDSTADGILVVDLQGQVVDRNDKFAQLWGIPPGLIASRDHGKIVEFAAGQMPDAEAFVHRIHQLSEDAHAEAFDELHLRDGRTFERYSLPQLIAGETVGRVYSFRDITERQRAEAVLEAANTNLKQSVSALEERTHDITLLNQMANMLQTCRTTDEAYAVIARFIQDMFPSYSGALFVMNASRNLLQAAAPWGDLSSEISERHIEPDDCWALRLGRAYQADIHRDALWCRHIKPAAVEYGHLCLPLTAQGDTLGILTIQAPTTLTSLQPASHKYQLAVTVADQIGLALANLRLRETLRRQSVRDPLTDLYNRRYLEETFERELQRAARNGQNVGVIMLDLDNFKIFNDTFGHGAGDVLLRELGTLLRSVVRGADVPCRYGGEEFMLILPDTPLPQTQHRAEEIHERVKQMTTQHRGQSLGGVTVSVGVAVFPMHGTTLEGLLHASDTALYRAKSLGKDRVVLAQIGQ